MAAQPRRESNYDNTGSFTADQLIGDTDPNDRLSFTTNAYDEGPGAASDALYETSVDTLARKASGTDVLYATTDTGNNNTPAPLRIGGSTSNPVSPAVSRSSSLNSLNSAGSDGMVFDTAVVYAGNGTIVKQTGSSDVYAMPASFQQRVVHPRLSRKGAEALLNQHQPKKGIFLLRSKKDNTVAMTICSSAKHSTFDNHILGQSADGSGFTLNGTKLSKDCATLQAAVQWLQSSEQQDLKKTKPKTMVVPQSSFGGVVDA